MNNTITIALSVLGGTGLGWAIKTYMQAVSSFQGVVERLKAYEAELVKAQKQNQLLGTLLGKLAEAGQLEIDLATPFTGEISVNQGEDGKVVVSVPPKLSLVT